LAKKPGGDSRFIRGIMRDTERATRPRYDRNEPKARQPFNPDRFKSSQTKRLEAAAGTTYPMPYLDARARIQQPRRELEPLRNEVFAALKKAEAMNSIKKADPDEKISANVAAARACTRGLQALCEHHFRKGGQPSDLVSEDNHLYESCIRGFHKCNTAARSLLGSYGRIGGSAAMQRQHELSLAGIKKNHGEALTQLKKYVKEERIPKVG